jgi:hypothetical protein
VKLLFNLSSHQYLIFSLRVIGFSADPDHHCLLSTWRTVCGRDCAIGELFDHGLRLGIGRAIIHRVPAEFLSASTELGVRFE